MTEIPSSPAPEPGPDAEGTTPLPAPRAEDVARDSRPFGDRDGGVEPIRLPPLLPRRQRPWLMVEVDGSPGAYGALVWALREAARRDATVVAVGVLSGGEDHPFGGGGRLRLREQAVVHDRLEAQILRAIAETGVHGRARTAVLDRAVLDALTAATHGADLVVVGPHGKSLLRHAVPRPPARRLARGA
jgi:nucleotide-binding universal stress UspA family protein